MSASPAVAVVAAEVAAASATTPVTPSASAYFPKCLQVSGPTDHHNRMTPHEAIYTCLRKAGAEFVGTFVIVFAAISGPIVNRRYSGAETLFSDAACAGLAVMIIVSSLGHICGAHLNPAVTLAFAATRHFPWKEVPGYIIAQVSGSLCASFAIKGIFHPVMSNGVTIPSIGSGQAFALEAIISFTLMLVIVSVATDTRAVGEMAALAIGGVVMLNILIAGPSTGASMNPARTLGPALAAGNFKGIWIYMVAPPIGALAGACAYRVLKLEEDDKDKDIGLQPPCDLRCFGKSDVCVWKGYTFSIRNCNIPPPAAPVDHHDDITNNASS